MFVFNNKFSGGLTRNSTTEISQDDFSYLTNSFRFVIVFLAVNSFLHYSGRTTRLRPQKTLHLFVSTTKERAWAFPSFWNKRSKSWTSLECQWRRLFLFCIFELIASLLEGRTILALDVERNELEKRHFLLFFCFITSNLSFYINLRYSPIKTKLRNVCEFINNKCWREYYCRKGEIIFISFFFKVWQRLDSLSFYRFHRIFNVFFIWWWVSK